jgi:hypothetical protein
MREMEAKIPAPGRDLKNVDPQVPPASREPSPVTRFVFGSLAIGFGLAMVAFAVVAAIFQASPLPHGVFRADEAVACLLVACSGLCFIGCGLFIFRRSFMITLVLLLIALVCGWSATAVA